MAQKRSILHFVPLILIATADACPLVASTALLVQSMIILAQILLKKFEEYKIFQEYLLNIWEEVSASTLQLCGKYEKDLFSGSDQQIDKVV